MAKITIRIDEKVKRKLEYVAQNNGLNLSEYVRIILENYNSNAHKKEAEKKESEDKSLIPFTQILKNQETFLKEALKIAVRNEELSIANLKLQNIISQQNCFLLRNPESEYVELPVNNLILDAEKSAKKRYPEL